MHFFLFYFISIFATVFLVNFQQPYVPYLKMAIVIPLGDGCGINGPRLLLREDNSGGGRQVHRGETWEAVAHS